MRVEARGRDGYRAAMRTRRDIMAFGAAAAGVAALPARAREQEAPARIRRSVTLGRTGLEVSDISFGSSGSADPGLALHALDRGVTFFDTAESYRFGAAEEALGAALAGRRGSVVLASKTKARADDRRDSMMAALEGSLRRLRTDYLDIYYLHSVNDPARIANPEWAEFTERARAQGKIRFRGMSGHGSRLAECLDIAIERDLADVILVAYNFTQSPDFFDDLRSFFGFVAQQPELPARLERAKEKNIGVVAMKTLAGARLNDLRAFERPGETFAQAAFRWVLSDPRVDGLVVSMTSRRRIDEYVAASGAGAPTGADRSLLRRYLARNGERYCRPACGACENACPHGVEIAEVLRARMYAADYGDEALARAEYAFAGLAGLDASPCLSCGAQPCRAACPHGLEIPILTRAAARLG